MADRPTSVIFGRDCQVLSQMFAFYAPQARVIRDVTANARKMWKGASVPAGADVRFYDIDPAQKPDVVCAWSSLPDADASVDVLVYDPPHLPAHAASQRSLPVMREQYGLALSTLTDDISGHHRTFLPEALRVLAPNGLIFAKLKDFVHNHRYQWTLADFIAQVRGIAGLTPCDLIIKRDPCGGNLASGRWKNAHHARNAHCWWVIIRKGRCEP